MLQATFLDHLAHFLTVAWQSTIFLKVGHSLRYLLVPGCDEALPISASTPPPHPTQFPCVSNSSLSPHLLHYFFLLFLFVFNLILQLVSSCLPANMLSFPWPKIFLLNSVSFLSPLKRCWSCCLYYFITYLTSCGMVK